MSPTTGHERHPLKVAPVPADHPYVRAVLPQGEDLRIVTPPRTSEPAFSEWQPHPYLEADQLRHLESPPEVIHLHFGFEHRTPDQIQEFVDTCADRDIRLVITVHDLDNPHLPKDGQDDHHTRLSILIRAADAVLTLTASAAAAIRSGYGREAIVTPHPFVVAPQTVQELRDTSTHPTPTTRAAVGVFLKDVRVNTVQHPGFYRDLHRELSSCARQVDLRVFAHRSSSDHPLVESLRTEFHPQPTAAHGGVLHLHERFEDRDLFAQTMSLDAVILPYTHGTHSGWLEMCRDLGVAVVAPDCGHYASQADRPEAVQTYRTGDGADAARATLRALKATTGTGSHRSLPNRSLPYRGDRLAQRRNVVNAHRVLLSNVVGGQTVGQTTGTAAGVAP